MHTTSVSVTYECQKGSLGFLELELKMIVNHCIDTVNKSFALTVQILGFEPSLQPQINIFSY